MARKPWPIPDLWPGETAVIVAGGPSLDLKQIRHVARARIAGKCRVFCVNDAIYPCWGIADWLHACDSKWWMWHRETAVKFPGIKTTCTETVPEAWAQYLEVLPPDQVSGLRTGFAEAPYQVAGGGNGGYQAIQCAVKAGCSRVLLLGFDMGFSHAGESHWHGDHPDGIRSDYEETMLPNFPGLADALKKRGIETINCSPGSALSCFPMGTIESHLP